MTEQTITIPHVLESYIQRTWHELTAVDSASVIEALKAAGSEIHTFSGNGGCDVPTSSVLESVQIHGARIGSDEFLFMRMGMGLGHEIAIIDQFGKIILVELAVKDLPAPGETMVPITLNTYDTEGNQVNTDSMNLKQDAVSQIVDQAVQLVLTMREMGRGAEGIESFDQVFSELEDSIVSADIVAKSYAPLPTLLLSNTGKSS
ncbi:hypothetical protein [Marinobacter shengliensis]|uniref:hypothetical protein n=1 Tax=Marinobacter shengliensis TaxID=1389223 RepID=UPI001107ED32|nr:hypothetical protein [Marinobacter shengliensis]